LLTSPSVPGVPLRFADRSIGSGKRRHSLDRRTNRPCKTRRALWDPASTARLGANRASSVHLLLVLGRPQLLRRTRGAQAFAVVAGRLRAGLVLPTGRARLLLRRSQD